MRRSAVIICRKEIFLLFLMFMGIIFSFAQKTIITDDDTNSGDPLESAVLDVYSANKGMLIPRLHTNAVSNPATGLIIYNSIVSSFYFYTGSSWLPVSSGQFLMTKDETVFISDNTKRFGIGTKTPIGPMAQNFHTIFSVGNNDKSLSTIDVDGVALCGIKALIQENNALKRDKSIKSKL